MTPTVFPSRQSPQRSLSPFVFPSVPTEFYHQTSFTNGSILPEEMSPGPVRINCAATASMAAQGTGDVLFNATATIISSPMNLTNLAGDDDAWLYQGVEDIMSAVFPSQSPQLSPFVFPSIPAGFYHQQNLTNDSILQEEMSPGPVQISCAATLPVAAQGTGNDQLRLFDGIECGDSSGICDIVAGA